MTCPCSRSFLSFSPVDASVCSGYIVFFFGLATAFIADHGVVNQITLNGIRCLELIGIFNGRKAFKLHLIHPNTEYRMVPWVSYKST